MGAARTAGTGERPVVPVSIEFTYFRSLDSARGRRNPCRLAELNIVANLLIHQFRDAVFLNTVIGAIVFF